MRNPFDSLRVVDDGAHRTSYKTITVEPQDAVLVLTLNRPDVLNAFNQAMQEEVRSVWREMRTDNSVNVGVVTGSGDRAFCVGNVMRRELSQRLGVEWGPLHNDSAEVAGVPRRVLREFSQRTDQITEWMDRRGVSGPAAKTDALLETRTSKHLLDDFTALEQGWHERADALGWGPSQLDALLGATRPGDPDPTGVRERWVIRLPARHAGSPSESRLVSFDVWVEWFLTTRVTENSATFDRFDLTRAVAGELPGTSDVH